MKRGVIDGGASLPFLLANHQLRLYIVLIAFDPTIEPLQIRI